MALPVQPWDDGSSASPLSIYPGQAGVTLDSVAFFGFEVPASMPWGGTQDGIEHKLPGGAKVVEATGAFERAYQWSGIFSGPFASDRAMQVDAIRQAGAPVSLTWGPFVRTVLVVDFSCSYERSGFWCPYRVRCIDIPMAQSAATQPTLLGQVTSDVGDAGGIGDIIDDVGDAIGAVGDAVGAVVDTVGSVLAPVVSAVGAVQSVLPIAGTLIGGTAAFQAVSGAVAGASGAIATASGIANAAVGTFYNAAGAASSLLGAATGAVNGVEALASAAASAGALAGTAAMGAFVGRCSVNLAAAAPAPSSGGVS